VLWLGCIGFFSTDAFSAEHSGRILRSIFRMLGHPLTLHQYALLNVLIRKSSHFLTYGFLGFLAFFSWRATFRRAASWSFMWSALAIALTLAAAALDEFHQSFVPSRTSAGKDVLLDLLGGLFFQFLILAVTARRNSSKVSPALG